MEPFGARKPIAVDIPFAAEASHELLDVPEVAKGDTPQPPTRQLCVAVVSTRPQAAPPVA